MTYKHHNKKCGLLCQLARLIRHIRWNDAKQPISWHLDTVKNGQAIHYHFGNKY